MTTIRDQVIRLADRVVTDDVLKDIEFVNVEIVGPAVLVLNRTVRIHGCNFDAPGPDALFWPIDDDRVEVVGAIGLENVVFNQCQFRRVGLAVLRSDLGVLRAGFGLE